MNKSSNMLFNKIIEYFMQDTGAEAEERYRLVMTEEEWEKALVVIGERYSEDELTEFRNDTLECMQGELSCNVVRAEQAKELKQCIEEMEQMPFECIKELITRLTRWGLETEGLPYIPDDQVSHPPGIVKDVRLLDWGGIRVTEDALKHILLNPPPSDAPPPPRLTDEQLEYINEYIQENCPELGVAMNPAPFTIDCNG
jgi:hypothetical protein